MPKRKKILFAIWVAVALTGIGFYFAFPQYFEAERIKEWLAGSQNYILLVYLLVSLVRGVFFIPSSPFVLAGAMLFPDQLILVMIISMLGIVAGGSYVYFFTEYLEVEKLFSKKYEQRFEKVKLSMQRYGIWIVMLWSFFPAVPTDLISYAAGVTRMPYWKFLLGMILGELPLVAIYVFSGMALGEWLLS